MEYNGKDYWTREELIETFDGGGFNELDKEGAFGIALCIPEIYDGIVYDFERFSSKVKSALTMQSFCTD